MKYIKALLLVLIMSSVSVQLNAHELSISECAALEYAIDRAYSIGNYFEAEILFRIYQEGGCWPFTVEP